MSTALWTCTGCGKPTNTRYNGSLCRECAPPEVVEIFDKMQRAAQRGKPDCLTEKTWQDAGGVGLHVEENDEGQVEIYDQAGYSIPNQGTVTKSPEEAEAFLRNAIDHPWYPGK